MTETPVYDPAADPVHGHGWNSAVRWGGWDWREPRYGEFFRTCSFCGSINPEDLAAELAASGLLAPCLECGGKGWEECFRNQKTAWFAQLSEAERAAMQPEELAKAEALPDHHQYNPGGWHASWADRKYGWAHKFYVEGLRSRDPSLLHCISSSTRDPKESSFGHMGYQWHKVSECPPELLEIARKDGMTYSATNPDSWLGFGTKGATVHAKFYTIHLADPRVPAEAKDKIEKASGLRFSFPEGQHVHWRSYELGELPQDSGGPAAQ